jgi:hypothetical protein
MSNALKYKQKHTSDSEETGEYYKYDDIEDEGVKGEARVIHQSLLNHALVHHHNTCHFPQVLLIFVYIEFQFLALTFLIIMK